MELLWAGNVDATKLETSALRSAFSAELLILRSDNAVAALVRPLDGTGSGDETAFSMLGTASIARSRYERGFTVAKGVLLFNERMRPGASLDTATFSAESAPVLGESGTADGLLLLASRSLLRIPDAGGPADDVREGFAYVHPSSGLTLLQTEDASRDWAALTDSLRGIPGSPHCREASSRRATRATGSDCARRSSTSWSYRAVHRSRLSRWRTSRARGAGPGSSGRRSWRPVETTIRHCLVLGRSRAPSTVRRSCPSSRRAGCVTTRLTCSRWPGLATSPGSRSWPPAAQRGETGRAESLGAASSGSRGRTRTAARSPGRRSW